MNQIAQNLTDSVDGLLAGKRYLIHDRDPLFTGEFLSTLKDAGVDFWIDCIERASSEQTK